MSKHRPYPIDYVKRPDLAEIAASISDSSKSIEKGNTMTDNTNDGGVDEEGN